MSSVFRVSFYLLFLGFIISTSSQFQSLASITDSSQSAYEESLRKITEQYGQAIAGGDIEEVRRFWNPQSPNLSSRLRTYQNLFSTSRIEFVSLKVTGLEINGDKAVSHLTTAERLLDKVTGTLLTEWSLFHGAVRTFEWSRKDGQWQIERESSLQEELVAKLEEANSEAAQQELLEKNKELVTDVLVTKMIDRSTRQRFNSEFEMALRSLRLAQAIAEKINDQAGLAKAYLYIAQVYETEGNTEQTLPLEQKALAIHQTAGNKVGEAIALFTISHTYHERGDYRKAFECAYNALQLAEELKHRGVTGRALSEMAHVYIYQNNPQQAVVCLEKAQVIAQELGDKIQVAINRFAIVTQQVELGHYEKALESYREILKEVESYGDPVGGAVIRQAVGNIYFAVGRYAEALDSYNQSLQASEAANFARTSAPTLIQISKVYLAQNKYKDALPFAERAVTFSRQIADKQYLRDALASKGYCHIGLNQPVEAGKAFSEAISTIEELRAQTTGGVDEHLRHFELLLDAYHGMLRLLVEENKPLEALVFAEKGKARGLLDMLQQGRVGVQKAMTAQEQEQEHRLKAELTRLNLQLIRVTQADKPDAEQLSKSKSELEKARLTYEAFQTSLYSTHPELKVQRGDIPVINTEELTALLPDAATALLEYVVTENKIYLFTITKATENAQAEVKVSALPIKREDIAKQIELFRQQLAARNLGFRASASKFYELLVKPAAAQLKGKKNLIITPDNVLWDLPFQTLVNDANRFLIEDAAISYAPSLTVLREMTRRRKDQGVSAASTTLLAMGNPLLGKETITRAALTLRDEKLDPLPEAEQEVKALKQLYGISRSKVYIGTEAREDRVKSEAGQARILHFAAHGMLNNASPMYSHLVLAGGGANEDGLLEAWELMQLDLKAELAVLSACETARGRIGAGEGIIGLSWAMFIAGVPSIVVSQWKVESAGTRDLMIDFHRAWIARPDVQKKPTKAEALQQAALKLMRNAETRHPFYWAGFVLVGDGR